MSAALALREDPRISKTVSKAGVVNRAMLILLLQPTLTGVRRLEMLGLLSYEFGQDGWNLRLLRWLVPFKHGS